MKIIIVIEDVTPTAESPANLDIKFMRLAKPDELANADTAAVEFADYMQMAANHYFESRNKVKVIAPSLPASKTPYH